jgi:hypothetical protein
MPKTHAAGGARTAGRKEPAPSGAEGMGRPAIYRQTPERVALLNGLFHANQATKIPKAMLVATTNNSFRRNRS